MTVLGRRHVHIPGLCLPCPAKVQPELTPGPISEMALVRFPVTFEHLPSVPQPRSLSTSCHLHTPRLRLCRGDLEGPRRLTEE